MDIGFNFKCNCCGKPLRVELSGQDFYIDPCQKCLKEASDSSFEAGEKEGYIKGFDDGQAAGLR
jgi:hypothetical protein